MGLTSLPAKNDASIGRVKADIGAAPNLDNYVPASEYEVMKDFLVDVCDEVGVHIGATGVGLNSRVNTLELASTGVDLQTAYNNGPAITIAPAVPIALATSIKNVGLTINDGSDILDLRADRIIAPPGTPAEPSITFSTPDCGVFRHGPNRLGLGAAGGTVVVDGSIASLRPDTDNVWDLGTAAIRYQSVYSIALDTGDIHLRGMNDDASFTMVEDRRGLFLRDNVTGKAFKIMMEEVPVSDAPRTAAEIEAGQ